MKVHVYAICWNEEIILPYFFKHYKQRFSNIKFTVYDNFSTDNSRNIIKNNGAELLDYDSNNEIRDDLYIQIKNNCWKNTDADWVIVCDIDEWIECSDTLLNQENCTIFKPMGYEMIGNTYNLDRIKRGFRYKKMDKCVLFKPDEIKEINYNVGCHICNPIGNIIYNVSPVPLYHMKYFNVFYILKRYRQLVKRLSKTNKDNLWGLTYTKGAKDIFIRYATIYKHSTVIRQKQK